MFRRHDNLTRMMLTLSIALLCGMLFEAQALHTWAKRLEIGPLREMALPLAERWHEFIQPSGLDEPRELALEAKTELAPWMAPEFNDVQQVSAAAHSQSTLSARAEEDDPVSSNSTPTVTDDADGSITPMVNTEEQTPSDPSAPLAQALANDPDKLQPIASSSVENVAVNSPADITRLPLASVKPTGPTGTLSLLTNENRTLEVVLAGDSMMAVGLAPTLTRGLTKEKNVHLIKAYRSGTGLARPEVFDWIEKYPQIIGDLQPDIIICSIGTNDGQNVQVGKNVLEFGSADWDKYYRDRLVSYIDMLSREKTPILWIGIPVMREPKFAHRMHHMNELTKAVVKQYTNVTWFDPNPTLGYTNDIFAQYGISADGNPLKLRADDGVHITDVGAAYLLPSIRDWLKRAATKTPSSDMPKDTAKAAPPENSGVNDARRL